MADLKLEFKLKSNINTTGSQIWFILIKISDLQHIKAVKCRSSSHDDDERLYKENYKKLLSCWGAGTAAGLTE